VQGITEFLPISSSGHNVLLAKSFNIKTPNLSFDIFVHLGSLLAVAFFFYRNYEAEKKNLPNFNSTLQIIFLSWIPVLLFGYFFRDFFDGRARDLDLIAVAFVVSGIFISIHLFKKFQLNFNYVIFLMAIFQIFAAFPGISRSGITIGIGLVLGLNPKKAILISFLMSIPVIFLAASYDFYQIVINGNNYFEQFFYILISFIISLVFSFIGIKLMLIISRNSNFKWFGVYNILVGIIILTLLVI